jgi:NAD(P)-dependent dehydrogenase (short-subunit alcohol dehydrogenase family)
MKKAALITGASSGIGAATAKLFSENGYFVYLLGRNEDRLNEVALTCQNGASLLKCDLSNETQLNKYTQHLFERPDTQLEVLVNNAGIFERHSHLEQNMDIWRRQFETNLFGAVALTQRLMPLFLKIKRGSIVNVASTLGKKPTADTSAYSASKAAMISWTKSLALELGPMGIRVNCVCPGMVDTPIHEFHSLPPDAKKQILHRLRDIQPLNRIGTSEEIAEAVYFLASEKSSWTTGSIFDVDGGINIK